MYELPIETGSAQYDVIDVTKEETAADYYELPLTTFGANADTIAVEDNSAYSSVQL